MVISEIAAATMIAVYGLKNSYRIILKGERLVRRKIRRPAPVLQGYDSFPRFFIRRVFRAGLVIAMRWEGRAKNAAQIAADARLHARKTSQAVAHRMDDVRIRAEGVRTRASDQAHVIRERAADVRKKAVDARLRAKEQVEMVRETAVEVRKRAEDVGVRAKDGAEMVKKKAAQLRQRATQAKSRVLTTKDRMLNIGKRIRERISSREKPRNLFTSSRSIVPCKSLKFPGTHTRLQEQ